MSRFLIIRDDKIGDFALNWPLFSLIRQSDPEHHISVLVASAVAPLARACPYIDCVYALDAPRSELLETLTDAGFDISLCFSAALPIKAIPVEVGIPIRLGNGDQGSSHLTTAEVNIPKQFDRPTWRDCHFQLAAMGIPDTEEMTLPAPLWDVAEERGRWRGFYLKDFPEPRGKLLMVHPGSGGSSLAYPIANYAVAIQHAVEASALPVSVVVSWGGPEKSLAKQLVDALREAGVTARLMPEHEDLATFARSLVAVDVFLACSTGPLHLASLHNVATVGLYAYKRERRWQTLTTDARRFSLAAPWSVLRKRRRDLTRIPADSIAEAISEALALP